MQTRRTPDGRFGVGHSDRDLFRIVRDVAHAVRPADPALLSVRAFNTGRPLVAERWGDVPSASAIIQRVNQGSQGKVRWPRIVEAALGTDAQQRQTLVTGLRSEAGPLPDSAIFLALRLAARETSAWLTPDEYLRVRERMLQNSTRRRRAALAVMLPTANQLIQAAGSWEQALAIAELAPPTQPEPAEQPGPAEQAARPRPRPQMNSMPIVDLICWFVKLQGSMPASRTGSGSATSTASACKQLTRPWREHAAEAHAALAAEGIDVPIKPVPIEFRRRETGRQLPPEVTAGVRRRGDWKDLDNCASAIAVFWDTLPERDEPKQRTYRQWAKGKPFPSPDAFNYHDGFTAVKERARELRADPSWPERAKPLRAAVDAVGLRARP